MSKRKAKKLSILNPNAAGIDIGAVLSLPKFIRFYVARDSELSSKVLKIFISEIERQLQKNLPDLPDKAKLGAITFVQRFGSTLNLHVHYHTVLIDGLFYQHNNQLRFKPVAHLASEDTDIIQTKVRQRVVRLFKRRELLTEEQASNILSWRFPLNMVHALG